MHRQNFVKLVWKARENGSHIFKELLNYIYILIPDANESDIRKLQMTNQFDVSG